jgi:DNA repair exonuclease SbcCD ATPase subunit
MGMLGGAASGAMTGFMLGGPVGAAIGGGVGLLGGLFGWLFGGYKKKRTQTELDNLKKQASVSRKNLEHVDHVLAHEAENLQKAVYLPDILQTKKNLKKINSDINYTTKFIGDHFDPADYKYKGAEASQQRSELLAKAKQQRDAWNQLDMAMQKKYKARVKQIESTTKTLTGELSALLGSSGDPFRYNDGAWHLQKETVYAEWRKTRADYKDSPEIIELSTKIAQEKVRQLVKEKQQAYIDIQMSSDKLFNQFKMEHLNATGASDAEKLREERDLALKELKHEIEAMQLEYAENQKVLSQLTQYETDRRVNIEKEAQEKIKQAYENTGQTLTELIQKRSDITNQFDFQRAKTRAQMIKDQLAEIDTQIREAFPDFVQQIQSLDFKTLNTMSAQQLAQLQSDVKTVSNLTTSNEFNNIITINAEGSTPNEVAKTIATELEKLLAAQRRFALP